jgi:uncharacterized protein (TIGR00661 family)
MKRIMVAPLDWGLGHATRCIPIIQWLLAKNHEVVLAGSGSSLELLRTEFPSLATFKLPGYDPQYPSKGSMVWQMALQLPKFFRVINEEHKVIEEIIRVNKIDAVISDNRYGCWAETIPSVFITHQSNILMPRRFGWLGGLVKKLSARQMRKFSRCWIPDFPGQNLAGKLISFGEFDPAIRMDYIGSLSRFKASKNAVIKYDVAAIFSGPEPQRSMLENIVLSQLKNSNLTWSAVRGLPSAHSQPDDNISDFLTSGELQQLIESAAVVISRSGYSTVMDLSALGKRAIFIPTPGQTEQEYLATRLMEMNVAFAMPQQAFDLKTAIEKSIEFSGFKKNTSGDNLLSLALEQLVSERL